MPYFIVFKNSSEEEIVKMIPDEGTLYEAVDKAIEGEYLSSYMVYAFHSSTATGINVKERIRYVGRKF